MRGLAEVVLSVRDVPKATQFYRDVVGLKVISPPELKGPVYLHVGDDFSVSVPHQVVLAPLPEGAPEFPRERAQRLMRHFAIEVTEDEWDQQRARLEGLGIPVRFGEHPFLPLKGLYFDDPDGNEIELMAPRR